MIDRIEALTRARAHFRPRDGEPWFPKSPEAEGGCGVTGFACTVPVGGKHIYEPSIQMRNRGNGKGGGIAACGLVPEQLGVSRKVLDENYILQVALLDPDARGEVEQACIDPFFDIDQGGLIPTVDDYRDVPLLAIKPPDVARYFVRVKPDVLDRFAAERRLEGLAHRDVEDEFVFQNSVELNRRFYASLGEKRACVLSHARNLLILKIVGYAEAVVQYYCMPETRAHVWIAHQRYPTRGRVWHPGGAHPFIGMNEALVHNGDFANYHSVCEFLAQRNLFPQFLTDTEVSVLLFDLMARVYKYPVEYIIEALAPTTELDFDRLPAQRRQVYRQIQAAHLRGSPDGPWFFIIARNLGAEGFQLLGITDTAMLRPQVFALQEGEVSVGLICSEKQAIDATLASLASEDSRISPVADMYWNARGGSHNDGGAFLMTVSPRPLENGSVTVSPRPLGEGSEVRVNGTSSGNRPHPNPLPKGEGTYPNLLPKGEGTGRYELRVANKFGEPVAAPAGQVRCDLSVPPVAPRNVDEDSAVLRKAVQDGDPEAIFGHVRDNVTTRDYDWLRWFVNRVAAETAADAPALGIEALTLALDRCYPTGDKKRSSVYTILRGGLEEVFRRQPLLDEPRTATHRRVDWGTRGRLRGPEGDETTLLVDARGFAAEGEACDARLAIAAYKLGWRRLVHYNTRGTRFHAAGFGPATDGLRIDCYDNPGDYLGSGMDGLEAFVHGNAQDQLCQITKCGKLVVYGDVGQTFLYGAKGGTFFVRGNVAGRPMINAVGRPRAVINGTALDFLAESFMAGNALKGGGFAVVNGLRFDEHGRVVPLDLPYPGSNLLSLASGGAIYVRDPHHTLVDEQLNGGAYVTLLPADWKLILPYLEENERLFGIRVQHDLLTVDGVLRKPSEVYRKVMPRQDAEIQEELEGMGE